MLYKFRFNGSIKALGYRTFAIHPRVLAEAAESVRAERMTPEEGALVFVATAQKEGHLGATPGLEYFQKRQRDAWEAEGRVRHRVLNDMLAKYEWRSFAFQ